MELGRSYAAMLGLDNFTDFFTMVEKFVMSTGCDHAKVEALDRIDGVDYVHCLSCGQVFEAEDLEPVAVYDEE